jgi:Ca2+ transporting ATPase
LNENERNQIIHDIIEKMANDSLRTICIGYKDLRKEEQNWENEDEIMNNLTCISIVGIEDPVREEVR